MFFYRVCLYNLESKITNSKMPKKVPTQARKEFSDTYSVSTVIIETNPIEKHSDTTEMDERMHSMIQKVFVMEWYFDLVFADIGFPLASVGDFVV
jgi:hypothetical protein